MQVASAPGSQTHRNTINKSLNRCWTNHIITLRIEWAIKDAICYRSDPSGKVTNLSKYSFSRATCKVLNKNLNFVPTPKNTIKTK